MAVRRTDEEIKEEIAKLKAIRPHVRRYTFFGDDNHAAIDVQIKVLERSLGEDYIYNAWGDRENLLENALYVANWRDGYEEEAPSLDWVNLTPEESIDAYYPDASH